ncbi:MAG: hypothetical protein ACKVZJ_11820 [Phycisphaerales bacterium]
MSERSAEQNEFYVGYLAMPRRHGRAMLLATLGLLTGFALLAGMIAGAQAFPGAGTWDATDGSTFEGTLSVDPYPRLRTIDDDGAPMEAVLVEQGKIGATARASAFSGKRVRVKGGLVRWGARAVVELAATPDDITTIGEGESDAPGAGEAVTLEGEIVDPKCYLGVMNPGFGKPHLACAELCIRGGIPPVLVVHSAGGPAEGECYLVTTASGGAANEMVRGWVGRHVRVRGVLRPGGGGGWGSLAAETIIAVSK